MRSLGTAVIGFGMLLLLVGLMGTGAIRRSGDLYEQITAAQRADQEVDAAIRDLPADLHLTGILVRDYVLDPSPAAGPAYKEQLAREQAAIEQHLARLDVLTGARKETIARLQRNTRAYVESIQPMLDWSPEEKRALGFGFIRENLIRRRQSIVTLAAELRALNVQHTEAEGRELASSHDAFQRFVGTLMWACLGLGAAVAVLSTWRVLVLERKNTLERARVEEAGREQRRLAAKVIQAQEEERKRVSLELHDAVGQMAYAVGMELGRLESAQSGSAEGFAGTLARVKRMNADVVSAIKDVATGLRPAMLDDLGLAPAIRAHAREVSRRTGVPVDVRLDGDIDGVPEPHRTYLYRIVQEALHNCARHAKAKHVIVSLYGRANLVSLAVQDDGVGFDATRGPASGLGLYGMRERVRDLRGRLRVTSTPGSGTLLEIELPLTERAES
jgi:signal transduction histidine kinase